jgi:phosphoserine phosphatase
MIPLANSQFSFEVPLHIMSNLTYNHHSSLLTKKQGLHSWNHKMGAENVVAIGNGVNDSLMLKKAALGIVVIGGEGAAQKTIKEADIVVKDIHDALGLLLNRLRLIATLRL